MEPTTPPPRSSLLPAFAAALGLAGASFAIGLARLRVSHPHEDAYILFQYVRNLAAGHGIVFRPDGPPTEGATDFLWLIALTLTRVAGVDVAIAAQAWNALGAGWLGFVLVRLHHDARRTHGARMRGIDWAFVALAAGVLATGAAIAGWAGFSSLAYVALVVWLADLATRDGPRLRRALPFAALVVGLVRPDGALLGVAFVVAAWVSAGPAGRERGWRAATVVALALGALYFAWRWWYFGELLPLPLVVKTNGRPPFDLARLVAEPANVLPGLAAIREWTTSRAGPLPFLAVWLGALSFARDRRRELVVAGLLACASAVFLLQLAFARPVQNHAFRFQAPVALLAAYAAWRVAGGVAVDRTRALPVRALALVALGVMWLPGLTRVRDQWAWDASAQSYMDVFPARARASFARGLSVVLTEAGRLPFWTAARAHDAVGLNESTTAHRPPDEAWLASVAPDVVFFHVADALELASDGDADVQRLEPSALERAVRPRWRAAYARDYATYPPDIAPETLAALVLARHVERHGAEYEVWAVRYQGALRHVWALRRSLPERAALVEELRASSQPGAWRPYAEVAAGLRER